MNRGIDLRDYDEHGRKRAKSFLKPALDAIKVTPSAEVDVAIRCDCGASLTGRIDRWRVERFVRAFNRSVSHAKGCRQRPLFSSKEPKA